MWGELKRELKESYTDTDTETQDILSFILSHFTLWATAAPKWYHQFPFAIHERCFNKMFKNNLVQLISFLILFCPIPSRSFALE